MSKFITKWIAVLSLAILFFSCGKDSDKGDFWPTVTASEVGTWNINSINGNPVSDVTFTFGPNKDYYFENFPESGESMQGTYKYEPFCFFLKFRNTQFGEAYLSVKTLTQDDCNFTLSYRLLSADEEPSEDDETYLILGKRVN